MIEQAPSNEIVKPTAGPYSVRPAVRNGKRVLEIITERYGFVVATVEPDDPEMRATAEIMAQSWWKYQQEQGAAPEPPVDTCREPEPCVAQMALDALTAKLRQLSMAMGNPALHWDNEGSIEFALIDEAVRRLAQPPASEPAAEPDQAAMDRIFDAWFDSLRDPPQNYHQIFVAGYAAGLLRAAQPPLERHCECVALSPRPWNFCQDCGGRITSTKEESHG